MEGKENRRVIVKACLAYCEPDKESVSFVSEITGTLAQEPTESGKEGNTSINKIFLPDGYDKAESEISREEMVKFWAKLEDYWGKLADYLK